jgi:hypothetical protein
VLRTEWAEPSFAESELAVLGTCNHFSECWFTMRANLSDAEFEKIRDWAGSVSSQTKVRRHLLADQSVFSLPPSEW